MPYERCRREKKEKRFEPYQTNRPPFRKELPPSLVPPSLGSNLFIKKSFLSLITTEYPLSLNSLEQSHSDIFDDDDPFVGDDTFQFPDSDTDESPSPSLASSPKNALQYSDEEVVVDAQRKQILPIFHQDPTYYTVPSQEEIEQMSTEQLKCLDSFVIGRMDRKGEKLGEVAWEGNVDVSSVDLNEVDLSPRSIEIYPDETTKPDFGKKLNREAIVRLHGLWPLDKALKQKTNDEKRLRNYGAHLRRRNEQTKSEFLSWSSTSGIWVFKVPHFSKYGASSSDDDEEVSEGGCSLLPQEKDNLELSSVSSSSSSLVVAPSDDDLVGDSDLMRSLDEGHCYYLPKGIIDSEEREICF
eukprot:CAMPEP_0201479842 /NCGR_PEP_ID=MMETSP0151_2-20130828/4483_1 /ASSEMBLY_ACC=CAM_ASM_000257 /TAXON_ID=200890 /ORGANISM="Paramoeba atlantica, Strain 621/1 / CCAP 1560/9" /LENGTH=354 /DNA_ID=CAMNT_0047861529 /DNA_START=157 /DNA_END=1221 /DNA_ORIENTATION=-